MYVYWLCSAVWLCAPTIFQMECSNIQAALFLIVVCGLLQSLLVL